MPKAKKKHSKPKPSDLGTGGAAKAARLLKNRKAKRDAFLRNAIGDTPKRKPAKKKAAKKRGK